MRKNWQKLKVNLKMRKNCKRKRYLLSLRVELKTFHKVTLKMRKICKKKKIFSFVESWTQDLLIMAEVGNYLENRSDGYQYSNLKIDGQMFLVIMRISRIYLFFLACFESSASFRTFNVGNLDLTLDDYFRSSSNGIVANLYVNCKLYSQSSFIIL